MIRLAMTRQSRQTKPENHEASGKLGTVELPSMQLGDTTGVAETLRAPDFPPVSLRQRLS